VRLLGPATGPARRRGYGRSDVALPDSTFIAELALLTLGYWVVDVALRRDGLARLLGAVGLGTDRLRVIAWAVPVVGLALVWRWSHVPQADAVRVVAMGIGVLLAWKATTRDVDVVFGDRLGLERRLLLVATVAVWLSPALLLLTTLLLSRSFGLWQHHATLPMRLLQAVVAFTALTPLARFGVFADAAGLFYFLVTIQAAHYLITALAKIYLGPYPWSWVLDNRIDHLAAGAWSWGWARFVPWRIWRRVVGALRVVRVPMQAYAFGIELLAPLALLDHRLAIVFCVAWSAFHLGVFATSGLLFWDWIGANLSVAAGLWLLPGVAVEPSFGVAPLLVGLAFMVAFPLRHKLFKPMPLGWWDTPFTQRMHWIAHGASGATYGVYADLMCPHERLYGKVHACFLAPHPVCTYHLGECWKRELRDALREAGPDLDSLDRVRERFGIQPRSEEMAQTHRRYLAAFFDALNRGERKHVLPRWLRWLKAPGGQIFHWGELEAFRGQEPIERVSLRYREEYFDGERLVRLRDELVETVTVAPVPVAERAREPTPKEIDDFLLAYADGRLIDLPKLGDGYVRGDDGKVVG